MRWNKVNVERDDPEHADWLRNSPSTCLQSTPYNSPLKHITRGNACFPWRERTCATRTSGSFKHTVNCGQTTSMFGCLLWIKLHLVAHVGAGVGPVLPVKGKLRKTTLCGVHVDRLLTVDDKKECWFLSTMWCTPLPLGMVFKVSHQNDQNSLVFPLHKLDI